MYLADGWEDFVLIDCGEGEKYERWGEALLLRPDPQAIWPMEAPEQLDARYIRSSQGGGTWEFIRALPEQWQISYRDLHFIVRPTGFKHTGLFPEQAVNWDWMRTKIEKGKKQLGRAPRVLNLFAYTGGATLACLAAGAELVHVDAAKGMVNWAKENAERSHLRDKPVRWIVDDVMKFVQREKRRGKQYEGIVLDPPSYGRGPNGEMWKIEDSLYELIDACADLLSEEALFLVINSYSTGLSACALENLLKLRIGSERGGHVEAGEIGLPVAKRDICLPCGNTGRWWKE